MSDTETTVEQREPLLDLSVLVDQRDFIIGPDQNKYYLRTDGLGAYENHRLVHVSDRHDTLFRQEKLSAAERKELHQLVVEMLEIVLDAPKEIRDQIPDSVAVRIVRGFQRASQPGDEEETLEILRKALTSMADQSVASTSES